MRIGLLLDGKLVDGRRTDDKPSDERIYGEEAGRWRASDCVAVPLNRGGRTWAVANV